jgi:phage shock protein B
MEDVLVPAIALTVLFIGLPWLILHYVTKWKQAPALTGEDEQLLDELHGLARRLEERLQTLERIVAADNPDFRPGPPPVSDTPYDYSRRN